MTPSAIPDDMQGALTAALADRYAIRKELGRGGMAVVFLADDLKHQRQVAIKVLLPELGAVLGVERFLSEIRVTATLQHPNLLPLFDSGEAGGLLYYVMPFVEGETLRARLDREQQLPVEEAVRFARTMAGALDYAHQRGVIHRDLKPENVLLQAGQPVIADFGIALAVAQAGGQRVTQTGLSLGTPQYMSPEQASGDRQLDGRTDIYALGAMTYEMLTGEPPHVGHSAQAIIAKLMTEEVRPLTVLRRSVPPGVDVAVRRALEKLPADRFARADELASALQAALLAPTVTGSRMPQGKGASRLGMLGAAGWVVGTVGAALAAWAFSRSPQPRGVQFSVEMPDSVQVEAAVGLSLAVSPDGQSLAFLGRSPTDVERGSGLYIRTLNDIAPRPLTNTRSASNPVFSDDGSTVVFFDGVTNELQRVAVAGGAPTSFAKVSGWLGNAWGNGDFFVYATYTGLVRVSRDGRAARVIASTKSLQSKVVAVTNPAILPDGKTVAARAIVDGRGQLALASVDSGPLTLVDLEIANVIGYYDGTLFFGRLDGTINAVKLDLKNRSVRGAPQTVLDGVSTRTEGGANAMLAPNGTLVFLRGSARRQLVVAQPNGQVVHTTTEQAFVAAPVWAPDGRRLALERRQLNSSAVVLSDVWLYDITSAQWSRVTTGLGVAPVWLPDGRTVAYESGPPYTTSIMLAPLDRSAAARAVATEWDHEPSFVPNSRSMIVARYDSTQRRSRLVRVSLDTPGKEDQLLGADSFGRTPRVSPDGKWVAYIADDETAGTQLFVTSLRAGGGRVQVSVTPDAECPRWGQKTNALHYLSGRTIRRVTLNTTGALPAVVSRDSLMTLPNVSSFDVSADEQRFAYVRTGTSAIHPIVFTDWARAVLAKLSTK
jgi:serine/threonine-protein kinase